MKYSDHLIFSRRCQYLCVQLLQAPEFSPAAYPATRCFELESHNNILSIHDNILSIHDNILSTHDKTFFRAGIVREVKISGLVTSQRHGLSHLYSEMALPGKCVLREKCELNCQVFVLKEGESLSTSSCLACGHLVAFLEQTILNNQSSA